MDERTITVPYASFVDGVTALADLDSIRALVQTEVGYCSDDIKTVLGIPFIKKKPIFGELLGDDNAVSD